MLLCGDMVVVARSLSVDNTCYKIRKEKKRNIHGLYTSRALFLVVPIPIPRHRLCRWWWWCHCRYHCRCHCRLGAYGPQLPAFKRSSLSLLFSSNHHEKYDFSYPEGQMFGDTPDPFNTTNIEDQRMERQAREKINKASAEMIDAERDSKRSGSARSKNTRSKPRLRCWRPKNERHKVGRLRTTVDNRRKCIQIY